jgi:asparagine synthase (glutamine-hydrolysing)
MDAVNALSLFESSTYMANMLLRDSDVMGMASSLEIRVPLIDDAVMKLCFSLPGFAKLTGGQKWLLRGAPGTPLPAQIWERPKRGFELPLAKWMKGAMRDRIRNALGASEVPGLRADAVMKAWESFLAGSPLYTWTRMWILFVLHEWFGRIKGKAT